MMKVLFFTKMVAAGNDFIVVDKLQQNQRRGLKDLALELCDRKSGVGADGLLVLESSKKADVTMRIFNSDGSEAEMCGNGARCAALYSSRFTVHGSQRKLKLATKAGIIESEVNRDNVRIKLTDPKGMKLDIPIRVNNRAIRVNFINTGVPHAVIFVEGLDKIDVAFLGREIRYHKRFAPAGTNADFVEVQSGNHIKVRTYERGVEDETLACGTGSVAAALIVASRWSLPAPRITGQAGLVVSKIDVVTKSGEILKVYFEKATGGFKNVWLEGRVRIVYKGAYYV
ncbi:MAG: diaminopimelate epimerase [Candidatus Omnitrophica bacterium]|nr:diaminopimelate epimerase [Candidatus Omnitrophota bacterium]